MGVVGQGNWHTSVWPSSWGQKAPV